MVLLFVATEICNIGTVIHFQQAITNMNESVASLLFSCPDRVGIIAALANYFSERKLSICRYEEYADAGRFFSRLEWQINDRWVNAESFNEEFASFAQKFNAEFEVRLFSRIQSLGLLASKQPHALIEILNKQEADYFPNTSIAFILGNDESMKKIADRYEIPFHFVATKDRETADYEAEQLGIINQYDPDYLGLARYMKVLSPNFLQQTHCPIINIHHSFLPSFVGASPYQMAYERGVKLIGATSHFVTEDLDQGPIIEQDVARVSTGSSVKDMIKMGRDIEQRVFAKALQKALENKAIIHENRTVIFS